MPLLLCPNCQTNMQALNRAGVEFDMCSSCRGVWLDRGELEKIIEGARASSGVDAGASDVRGAPDPASPSQPARRPHDYGERGEYGEGGEYGERGEHGYGRRRKRGFDMFDIFD